MNLQKLMQQAQQMQERLQQELKEIVIDASAGGGMVVVKMNGHKHLLATAIDPEVLDPEDPEMLQDLIVAAVNEAARKVDEEMQRRVGSLSGGLSGLMPGAL
jgi:DNA-binding YbaB/EbfC family protein